MAAKQSNPLPLDLQLSAGYVVRFSAVDATTGATVAGVTISDATIEVQNLTGGSGEALQSGPFMFVPGPEA